MQSGKLFDSWSHSKFISNQKYNFSREEILKVLPKSFIDEAYTAISNWEGYKPTRACGVLGIRLQVADVH